MNPFIILLLVVLLLVMFLINFLIKKYVNDEKKKRAGIIVVDIFLGLLMVYILVDFMAFKGMLPGSGKQVQKRWIYETLPQALWQEQATTLADNEYKRLVDVLTDYANDAITKYDRAGRDSDRETYAAMSFWGLDDLYLMSGGSTSKQREREQNVELYKNHYSTIVGNLKTNMSMLLRLRDSTLRYGIVYTDSELCALLLGKPDAIAQPSPEYQLSVARAIITNLYIGREKPSVSSTSYDRKSKLWTVRLDGAPTQTVQFFKRDDGEYDVEWTGCKGYIPKLIQAPVYNQVSDEEEFEEPTPSNYYEEGRPEIDIFNIDGYLEESTGERYSIDMTLTVGEQMSDSAAYAVKGSYHYASQDANKRIELTGTYESNYFLLRSGSGKETFKLDLNYSDKKMEGDWYRYKDRESGERGGDDYQKHFKVHLRILN